MRSFSGGQDITDDIYHHYVTLFGPEGTPYENGRFKVRIDFPDDYPFSPPDVTFISKIFHPNIAAYSGKVCIDILDGRCAPHLMTAKILFSI